MLYTFAGSGRSKFSSIIIEVVRSQRQALDLGKQIIIEFDEEKPGYPGGFVVNINPKRDVFTVEFSNVDPSRFPARIKATAIALCQEGFEGKFEISHKAGTLKLLE